jgi:hypothetical protein
LQAYSLTIQGPRSASPVWVPAVDMPRTPVIRNALGGQIASHKNAMVAVRTKIQQKVDSADVPWLHIIILYIYIIYIIYMTSYVTDDY